MFSKSKKGIELNLFKKQLKFFKKNFSMISAEELNYLLSNKTKSNFKKPSNAPNF